MHISKTIRLLSLGLVLSAQVRAQDAEAILKQSAERYRALEAYDMEAEVSVVTSTSFGEQEFEMRVRMAERPPSYVRAEVDSRTMQLLVVMNDDGAWMYVPEQNEYAFAENGAPSELGAVSKDLLGEYKQLDARVEEAKLIRDDTLLVDGVQRFAAVIDVRYEPVETSAGADSTRKRLWIDRETALVLVDDTHSLVSETPFGEPLRVHEVTHFVRAEIAESPSLELFAFVPPEGAREVGSLVEEEAGGPISEGALAPAISLADLDGEKVNLADFEGRVVLVNFWATWCGPCRMEMPELDKIVEEHGEKGLVVLGVNLGEPEPVIRAYREQTGVSFPLLLDEREEVGRRFGVRSLPTTVVVDRQGRVSSVLTGAHHSSTILEAVRQAGL